MSRQGIIYAATNQDRYVEEAFLSAESLRRLNPDLPVTLFTDRPKHPLCDVGVFNEVIPVARETGFASDWAAGQLARLLCLARTPYDHTLHIDTDTRVQTNALSQVFQIMETHDVAMVETAPDSSYSRRHYGRPMYNAGFILYRRNERTWKWLTEWVSVTERNFRAAGLNPLSAVAVVAHVADETIRRELLCMDQTSLVEMLTPDGNTLDLNVKTLDYSWNFTGSRLPENNREPVKILHSSMLKKTTHADILEVAYEWDQAGRCQDADRLYDYIADKQNDPPIKRIWKFWPGRPPKPEVWATSSLRKADLHLRYGQGNKAGRIYGDLIAINVADAYALAGHARLALLLGCTAEALGLANEAAVLRPDSPYILMIQGAALIAAGRPRDAIAPLERAAVKRAPNAAFQLGQAWMALKDYERAAASYQRELKLTARHAGAVNNLMPALLGARRFAEAMSVAEQCLTQQPWHVPALAFKSVALAELGRMADHAALVDHNGLIKTEIVQLPSLSRDTFNRDLAKALRVEKTLTFAPPQHATRAGWHSEDLSHACVASIQALNALILDHVRLRIEGVSGNHPFALACPQSYRLHTWAVVMEKGGHQIPHIHSGAWLSGVYYVEVPDEIREDDPERKGWLTFGRAEERWQKPETKMVERQVCPRPGLLVTFPAFFWHGTRPITTSRRRISYAFDVVAV